MNDWNADEVLAANLDTIAVALYYEDEQVKHPSGRLFVVLDALPPAAELVKIVLIDASQPHEELGKLRAMQLRDAFMRWKDARKPATAL